MQQPFPCKHYWWLCYYSRISRFVDNNAIWNMYALCFCWKSIITGVKTAISISNVERLFASFMFTVNCCTLPSNASQVFCNLNRNLSGETPVQHFLAAGTAVAAATATPRPVQLRICFCSLTAPTDHS